MFLSSAAGETVLPADLHAPAGWSAELELRFARRGESTVLAQRRHAGPLRVQRPLYQEGPQVCQAIVLHPPGGIVGGDRLALDIRVEAGAHAMLTTPGAAKWYRSAGLQAQQTAGIHVEDGGVLEWFPHETIVFDAARAKLRTSVELSGGALFLGWDITCFGRSASGERFGSGWLIQSTRIERAGRPLFVEYAQVDGGSRALQSRAGLAGYPVSAVMLAAGRDVDRETMAQLQGIRPGTDALAGVTALPGVTVARFLGRSAEAARGYLTRLWAVLRPALTGLPAQAPRIWSC